MPIVSDVLMGWLRARRGSGMGRGVSSAPRPPGRCVAKLPRGRRSVTAYRFLFFYDIASFLSPLPYRHPVLLWTTLPAADPSARLSLRVEVAHRPVVPPLRRGQPRHRDPLALMDLPRAPSAV